MIKVIIWGLGRNGKILYEILGKKKIVAYIDSNVCYQNTEYKGVPVITLEEYKKYYSEFTIIISAIVAQEEIEKVLLKHGIENYYKYLDDLDAIRTFFLQIDKEYFLEQYKQQEILLYENTLFGLLVSDYLQEQGFSFQYISKNDTSDFYIELKNSNYCYHPELKKFKNCHQGQRCFIVATGPSLRIEDLETLQQHNELCISVNGIFKGFEKTNWRPDYYIISDPAGMIQWKDDILKMDVKEKFIADVAFFFSKEQEEKNIHKWHIQVDWGNERLPQFTDDFAKISFCGDTITYDGALQLAVYMGFKEIYLLGVDCCQYAIGEKQHFVENYQSEEFKDAKINSDKQRMAYESAKIYAETHFIRIYNATRGGFLEVFERVNFDDLFDKLP